MRAAVLMDLEENPAPRGWRIDALVLFLAAAIVSGGSVVGASMLFGAATRIRGSSAFIAVAVIVGMLAAVRPPSRTRTIVAALAVVGAMVSAAAGASAQRHALTLFGDVDCALVELGVSVLPAMLALATLRRFSFSPAGSRLAGLAVGLVGVLTLDLTCPVGTAGHVVVFHLAPCVLIAAALVVARFRSRTHSFAP